MAKSFLKLICCLAAISNVVVAVSDKNIGKEKLKGKLNGGHAVAQLSSQYKVTRDISSSVSNPSSSPTKFGFVPTRTASSYATKTPPPTYLQQTYNVKDKREPSGFQSQQIHDPPNYAAQQISSQHSSAPLPYLQPELATAEYSQHQTQPYNFYQLAQSGADAGVNIYQDKQPSSEQYQQQYASVQYVADNGIAQFSGQKSYDGNDATPQYYYVPQYQEPSAASDAGVDQKGGVQYIMYVPSSSIAQYSQNSIAPNSHQYLEYQSPITSTQVSATSPISSPKYSYTSSKKYTTAKYPSAKGLNKEKVPEYQYTTYLKPTYDFLVAKYPSAKGPTQEKAPEYQYSTYSKPELTYENSPSYATTYQQPSTYEKAPEYQYSSYQNTYQHQPKEIIFKRHPKSLLDSYIPSAVQLRWLEQQKQSQSYVS